jgi:tetratricopeptide (TPR) repeat protein
MEPELSAAARAYAEANARWQRRDAPGALEALLDSIRLDPTYPNAKSFAGWLLTTALREHGGALERGLALLREAVLLEPSSPRPIANLVEALVTSGEASEAIRALEEAAQRTWLPEHGNLLGWVRGVVGDDLEGSLRDLDRALGQRRDYGDALLNRARVLDKRGDAPAARAALLAAIRCGNCWRPAEAWLRLGAIDEARGHARRALRAFRRAADLDAGLLRATAVEAVQRVGQALLGAGRFILHADDETLLNQALERSEVPAPPSPAALHKLGQRAHGARNRLASGGPVPPAALLAALDAVHACSRAGQLLPAWADRSLALEIAAHADRDPELASLADRWRAAALGLYAQIVDDEEPNDEPDQRPRQILRLARAGRWPEVEARLDELELDGNVELVAALAEELAEMAEGAGEVALRLCERSLAAYERFASWSTSGGEGTVRMTAVNRLLARLGRPTR